MSATVKKGETILLNQFIDALRETLGKAPIYNGNTIKNEAERFYQSYETSKSPMTPHRNSGC